MATLNLFRLWLKSFFWLKSFLFSSSLCLVPFFANSQPVMPAAVSIDPQNASGEDSITITMDIRQICTSEKNLPFTGEETVYLSGWIKVLADGKATWWNGNYHPDPGTDGSPSTMTYNGDSTYSIRIKPSTFFHSDGHEIMGFSLKMADFHQQRQAFDHSPFGCAEFYVPLKTDPPLMDTSSSRNTLEIGGLIRESIVLDFDTLRISNHLTVDHNVTLTIDPGTIIEFQDYYYFDVYGTLIAEGTEAEGIFFKAKYPAAGWGGLRFKNQKDLNTSKITYCRFENMITYHDWHGVIDVSYYPRLSISHSIITNNAAHAINLTNSDISIDHTTLSYNRKGGVSSYASHARFLNCQIVNNNNHGLWVNLSNLQIINCLINNNETDGMALTASDPKVINSIVAYNGGRAIYLEISNPEFYNSVIFNNAWYIDMKDPASTIRFKRCILPSLEGELRDRGQFPEWEDNYFDEDPMFLDPPEEMGVSPSGLSADWSVEINSVAVNNGFQDFDGFQIPPTDFAGNERISHGIIDIGALEFSHSETTLIIDDDIYDEEIWMADTVKVTQDVFIHDGAKLTIAPNTIVEFQGHYEMIIEGCLIAKGTMGAEIRFTVFDNVGYDNYDTTMGNWEGLDFRTVPGNPASEISWCIFEYAADMEGEDRNGGAISIGNDSWPQNILNCLFQYNYAEGQGGALSVGWAGPFISLNEFRNNTSNEGGAIFTSPTSSAIIYNNYIHHNTAWSWGGGIYTSGAAIIKANRIAFNTAHSQGGGVYCRKSKAGLIGNFIYNNSYGGIACKNADPYIVNNLIVNNSADGLLGYYDITREGSGIFIDINSDATIANNTIANNFSSQFKGSSVWLLSDTKFYNNIIWGNVDDFGNPAPIAIENAIAVDIRNCIIEGGMASIRVDNPVSEVFTDVIIDSLPQFVIETAGAGAGAETGTIGIDSVWKINALSPAINNGVFDPRIIGELFVDYSGNQRNQDAWDIGAFEHPTGRLEISSEPMDIVSCSGDTIGFSVMANDTAYYKWFLNEKPIPGANGSSLKIEGVTREFEGLYSCAVWNAYGGRMAEPSFLIVNHPPEIFIQPDHKWMIEGTPAILEVLAEGSPPMEFQWYKDGAAIPEADRPKLMFHDPGSETEGMYYCNIENFCGTASTDSIQLFLAPQICMVTIDTVTGNNLVIWEKKTSAPIESYNVYRESIVAGEYDVLGNVPATNKGVFSDTGADPSVQAYIYKITALDPEGNESDINLCKPHKTIHLLTSLNTEYSVAQLDWDHYYGFQYGTFHIFRSDSKIGFDIVHAMASSTTTWTDRGASEGQEYFYRVAVERQPSCNPEVEGKKDGTAPYKHSLSNMDDNKIKSTGLQPYPEVGNLMIYPNPMRDQTRIMFSNPGSREYTLYLRDLSGKTVRIIKNITTEELVLLRGNLEPGYYSVEIRGSNTFRGKLIID